MLSRPNVGDSEDSGLRLAGKREDAGRHQRAANSFRSFVLRTQSSLHRPAPPRPAPPGACAGNDERKEHSRRAPESPPGPSARVRITFSRAQMAGRTDRPTAGQAGQARARWQMLRIRKPAADIPRDFSGMRGMPPPALSIRAKSVGYSNTEDVSISILTLVAKGGDQINRGLSTADEMCRYGGVQKRARLDTERCR